jgi:hypothetical protein
MAMTQTLIFGSGLSVHHAIFCASNLQFFITIFLPDIAIDTKFQ